MPPKSSFSADFGSVSLNVRLLPLEKVGIEKARQINSDGPFGGLKIVTTLIKVSLNYLVRATVVNKIPADNEKRNSRKGYDECADKRGSTIAVTEVLFE